MWLWVFFALLSATGIFLLIKFRKLFFPKPIQERETIKISQTTFVEHGEAKWQLIYQVKDNNAEEIIIETVPYCKNCNVQYQLTSPGTKALNNLKCPSCGEIKIGYPLSTNYHSVTNLAEMKVKEMKKRFKDL